MMFATASFARRNASTFSTTAAGTISLRFVTRRLYGPSAGHPRP